MSALDDLRGGVPSEPVDAEEAFATRDRLRDDPGAAAILMPTLEDFLDQRRGPVEHLHLIRLLTGSIVEAFDKAIAYDTTNEQIGEMTGSTGVQLENALVTVYGEEPRLLARFFVQALLDEAMQADDRREDEPTTEPTEVDAVTSALRAAIASLETGAIVEDIRGDWWRASGVHPAPGESLTVTIPIRLTVTGRRS